MHQAMTLETALRQLSRARRKKIEARAADLIAEELSLRDLRRARALTQARVAKRLNIKQESVSRLEKRSDLLLSTLRDYVNAMGGSLQLIARFPDRPPVALTGLSAAVVDRSPKGAKIGRGAKRGAGNHRV